MIHGLPSIGPHATSPAAGLKDATAIWYDVFA